jgi:hypothetical protein
MKAQQILTLIDALKKRLPMQGSTESADQLRDIRIALEGMELPMSDEEFELITDGVVELTEIWFDHAQKLRIN